MLDPPGGVLHRVRREAAAVNTAVDFATKKTRGFEDAEVLGDGGEGDVEGSGQLSDGGFAFGQPGQDGTTRGIGEGTEGSVEALSHL
jgi:hypothetical protein